MAAEATFPKRKLTAEQKRTWKKSPEYKAGVFKARTRRISTLHKIIKANASLAEVIKAKDEIRDLEAVMLEDKKRSA